MKKTLFFVALASLALASCSQDEVTELNRGRAIDFRAATLSRGSETTTANIKNFHATAFNGTDTHFADVLFSKEDASGFFTSTDKYYWPADGATLSFVAWSPSKADLGGTMTLTSSAKTLAGFAPKSDVSEQVDFVYATATGDKATCEASGVALTFGHALSQVGVLAKNSGALVCKVAGVKFCNVASKGDFNIVSEEWTPASDKTSYIVELTDAQTLGAEAATIMGAAGNAMLVPQQLTAWDAASDAENTAEGAYLAVKVNIANDKGAVQFPVAGSADSYAWVAVPLNTKWEAGKKYVYTLDFSNGAGSTEPEPGKPSQPALGAPIQFTVTVSEWTPTIQSDTKL